MRTIAFATQKGGSGKSTLAIGIAVAAIEAGESVFMLEADRQGTVSKWGERRSNPEPGIDRIASGVALERALKLLAAERFSLAIIDTPGTDNVSATAAIRVADLCLIPARPSPADIEAALPTLHAARRLDKNFAFEPAAGPSTTQPNMRPRASRIAAPPGLRFRNEETGRWSARILLR